LSRASSLLPPGRRSALIVHILSAYTYINVMLRALYAGSSAQLSTDTVSVFYCRRREGRFFFFLNALFAFESSEPGPRTCARPCTSRVQYIHTASTTYSLAYNTTIMRLIVPPFARPIKLCGRGIIIHYEPYIILYTRMIRVSECVLLLLCSHFVGASMNRRLRGDSW